MDLNAKLIKVAKDHYHIDSKGEKTSPSDHKGKGEEAPHDHSLKSGGKTDMRESGKPHKHKEPSGEMTGEAKTATLHGMPINQGKPKSPTQSLMGVVKGFSKKAEMPEVSGDDVRLVRRWMEHFAQKENMKLDSYVSDKEIKDAIRGNLSFNHGKLESSLNKANEPALTKDQTMLRRGLLGGAHGLSLGGLGAMALNKNPLVGAGLGVLGGGALGLMSAMGYDQNEENMRRKGMAKDIKKQLKSFPERKKELMKDVAYDLMDDNSIPLSGYSGTTTEDDV